MLQMKDDGNLVLSYIDYPNHVLWESKTSGRGERLMMEPSGNLVIYDNRNNIIWETSTSGRGEYMLVDKDGYLVVYDSSGVVTWSTKPIIGFLIYSLLFIHV